MSCLPTKKDNLAKHIEYVYQELSGGSCATNALQELVESIPKQVKGNIWGWSNGSIKLLTDSHHLCLLKMNSGWTIHDQWAPRSAYLYWDASKWGASKIVFWGYDLKKRNKLAIIVPKSESDACDQLEAEWRSVKELKSSLSCLPKIYPTALRAEVLIEEFAGVTLDIYLSKSDKCVFEEFAVILYQLIKALLVINDRKSWKDNEPRFYPDIKPNHICISYSRAGSPILKLIDLGSLCKFAEMPASYSDEERYSPFYWAIEATKGHFDQKTHAYAVGSLIFDRLDTNLRNDLFAYEKELKKISPYHWELWRREGRTKLTQNAHERLAHAGLGLWAKIIKEALAEDPADRLTLHELKPLVKKLSQKTSRSEWHRNTKRHYQLVEDLNPYEVPNMPSRCICGFAP